MANNTTKTTAENITDEQIEDLMIESGEAGDLEQVAICHYALYGREYAVAYAKQVQVQVDGHTRGSARAECARVIADAEAAAS